VANRRDGITVLLLAGLVLAVFWRATLGGIFFFGDIYELHYPLRSVYAEGLRRWALPLWTPNVMGGYPLLAEGQLGALYPPNLVLHALFPVPVALNIFILGHFVLAGIGAYAFARQLKLGRLASVCTGLVYALGGFMVAHLNHINIVACAAWMPWLFLLTERILGTDSPEHRARDPALLGCIVGLELLAGHAQIALLTLAATGAYALYLTWAVQPGIRRLSLFAFPLLLGVGMAAVQLLPSYELTQASVRSEGLDPDFFASFSLHPLCLITLLWPFILGNPYPNASVELVGYVGWLPLLLAILAPFVVRRPAEPTLRSSKRTLFFAGLALVALALALGRWNPMYMLLVRLPGLNLFRVPARYLYWFSFAAAVLAGMGLDKLSRRGHGSNDPHERVQGWLVIAVVGFLTLLTVHQVHHVEQLVAAWFWLPVVLALLGLGWVAWTWRASRVLHSIRGIIALALVVIDLILFNSVFNLTYNQTMSLGEFTAAPRSLSIFPPGEGTYRVHTHEEIVPVLSVMRESLYPNLSLLHRLASGNGRFPLVLARYSEYVQKMTPRMLDLFGIRYYVIPQVLPVDEASEFYDVENPWSLNPVGRTISIEPLRTAAVEVESYLSHSVDWPDGQAVADIRLHGTSGELEVITLRAGSHSSEWAYSRSDVSENVLHRRATVIRSWPARSGFPPEDHVGHTYTASFRLETTFSVNTVVVQPRVPLAYIRIERLKLIDHTGATHLLSHLAGKGDHTLVYRSEDAAIYENHDVLPRAFIVHRGRAVPDDSEALRLLMAPEFDPNAAVLLATDQVRAVEPANSGEDSVWLSVYDSGRVVIEAQLATDGYLVLTDTWYPGWDARIDGKASPILRANLMFRAVYLPAGYHIVEFTYTPQTFRLGLKISAAALLLLVVICLSGTEALQRRPAAPR